MVLRALVQIRSPVIACRHILGLPALIRTLKSLYQSGCKKFVLVGADEKIVPPLLKKYGFNKIVHLMPIMPKKLEDFLVLSGETHYDPEFIRWMVKGNVYSPEPYLKEVPGSWWGPLDGPHAARWVEKKLLSTIHQSTEGWAARYINKPISFRLSRLLVKTPITPNQITFACLALAVLACFLLMQTHYLWRVVGALIMYFSSVLDGCDGEVARLKLQTSKTGAWLDTVVDDVANNLFLTGLFVGIYRTTQEILFIQAGLFILVLSVLISAMLYYQLIKVRKSANAKDFKPLWGEKESRQSWFEWIRPVMKRDFFIGVLLIFVLFDLRIPLFWIAAVSILITFFVHLVSFGALLAKRIRKEIQI